MLFTSSRIRHLSRSALGASAASVASRATASLGALVPAALALAGCDGRLEVTDVGIGGSAGAEGNGQGGSGGMSSGGAAGSGGSGLSASCTDGIRNGDEAGVDCGGAQCTACASGNACTNPVQCESSVCTGGICQPASCDDGIRNGDEAGVDCGGTSDCGACLTLCHEECAVSDALIPVGCDPSQAASAGSVVSPRASDDGSIIGFGHCDQSSRCTAFYWTATDGTRALSVTGGGIFAGLSGDGQLALVTPQVTLGGEALLFSPDGTSLRSGMNPGVALLGAGGALVGVGASESGGISLLRRRGDSTDTLGELSDAASFISAATPDASVIVGHDETGRQPFVYTDDAGSVLPFDDLPDSADGAFIGALSRDGNVLAGVTYLSNAANAAISVFRWTEASGTVELAPAIVQLTPGVNPQALSLSDDGSVLAFSGSTPGGEEFSAFRWTTAGGVQALAPGLQSTASIVSGDGRLIIGQSFEEIDDYRPFVWTQVKGARSIRAALETAGVDLRGWILGEPTSLSRDARIATGIGYCGGIPTAYRMVLPE